MKTAYNEQSLNTLIAKFSFNFCNNDFTEYLQSADWTSCASVANDIHGSLREKSAQDFDLKLIPWKHANDIFVPCNSIVPPRTEPKSGKGSRIVDKCKPATMANTFCQCRWCLASWTTHADCWGGGTANKDYY